MSELRDLLVMFEWLSARDGCSVIEACERFGLERAELEDVVNTLSFVGFLPEDPGQLLNAYIDEDDDTVHVAPFDGLERGISIELETALRLDTLAHGLIEVAGGGEVTRRAADRLHAAIATSGIDPQMVSADLALPGSEHVQRIGAAIAGKQRLEIRYQPAGGAPSDRVVEPIGLFLDPGWYLEAFDLGRDAKRHFKLERIVEVMPTGETLATEHHAEGSLQVSEGDTEIVLELEPAAGWLLEQLDTGTLRPAKGGRKRVILRAGGFRWLVPLLLSAGPHVEVIEPAALGDALRAEIDATLERYN